MITPFPKEKDFRISTHLHHREFRCKCKQKDCTQTLVDIALVEAFEHFRAATGEPLYITSGFRCQWWNSFSDGSPKSTHKLGMAMDLIVPKGISYKDFALKADSFFNRVLANYESENFIHVNM